MVFNQVKPCVFADNFLHSFSGWLLVCQDAGVMLEDPSAHPAPSPGAAAGAGRTSWAPPVASESSWLLAQLQHSPLLCFHVTFWVC